MTIGDILEQLNIFTQCRKYRVSLWYCPQFLFVIMGIVIMATAIVTYLIGTQYVVDPDAVIFIVFILTIILFVITFSIIRSMEGLAEANRLKSEFVSVVSHQLRSPLSNLKWAIEVLTSGRFGKLSEKEAEYVKILEENSARMGELISDLLTVSRIEQGRLPFQKTLFSLEDLVKEVAEEFKPLAEASHIKIELAIPQSLPMVFADSTRIKAVVENLLDNAIRYIREKGEVKIKLKAENKRLRFEIEDTGVGIPKKDQGYIFQKFFRSKNILKYQTQGSGLGLNIAQSIIEKSGGKLWFKSKENKGSTFCFTLPIKK